MLSHGETNKSDQIYKIYCEIPLVLALFVVGLQNPLKDLC